MSFQAEILQFLLAGITVGSIYALIALGFVTIYNVTGIINFAQGEFAVYGAFIAITVFQKSRLLSGSCRWICNGRCPWPPSLASSSPWRWG